MKAVKITLALLAVLLLLALVLVTGGYYRYRANHIKIDGQIYDKSTTLVDIRGKKATVEDYQIIRDRLPGAEVRWDVPFQDTSYPDDTTEITVSSLSREDLERLDYLPGLTRVEASQCRDYDTLLELEKRRPDCQVHFLIHLGDQALERDAQSLTLTREEATAPILQEALTYLPQLTAIDLQDPAIPASELYTLQEQNPQIRFTWNKAIMGTVYETDLEELDLSETDPGDLKALEQTLDYFPNLKQLVLIDCGYENEELAAFREQVRGKYKVVWQVNIGKYKMRTDATSYMPSNTHIQIHDEDTYNLRYCEDLIAVDFGHINVGETSWVVGTPHLKYLILGDGNVFNKHMEPLSCLKELEFLEVFRAPVTDISPLVECTGLRDLLLSGCYIDPTPLAEMPWLENLWLLGCDLNYKEKEFLLEKLPNTHMEMAGTTHSHSYGWRDLPRYFEMRDALGMWYMTG